MRTDAVDQRGDPDARGACPEDGLLLDQFMKDGNQEAFATLIRRHGPYILGVCRRVTSDPQEAEDVFQACFLELVRNARSIRDRNSVAGWLQSVAVRLGRKARARRARQRRHERARRVREAIHDADAVTWGEVRRALEEEVALLPEELRLPIVLCLFQERTQDEAAQYLELNPRTLKDRLRRGRELLRKRLTRRGITLGVLGSVLCGGSAQAAVPAALQQVTVKGAAALVNKASLVGVVSPGAAALAGTAPLLGTSGALATAALAVVLSGGAAYVAWDRFDHLHGAGESAQERSFAEMPTVRRSFRRGQFDSEFFQWSGPVLDYVRHEEEGLRIVLPAENGPGEPVGVMLRYPVRGDFAVEATFEFVRVDQPDVGFGAGVTVYLFMDSPDWDGLWFGKMNQRRHGVSFVTGHRIGKREDRVTKFADAVPSPHEGGLVRLRIARRGPSFLLSAAEGETGEYLPLQSLEISEADVPIVRFAVDPGSCRDVVVDARLVDFSITAQEFVGYEGGTR